MTYAVGSTIEAADYTGFRGVNAANVAYANDAAAQNKLAALIGVGYGTRGYGQTNNVIIGVSPNIIVTAAQWNSLRDAMVTVNVHTGIGTTLPNVVTSGNTVIQANNGTLGRPNVANIISTFDTNRFTFDITQMTLSSVLSSTRSTAWNTSVLHEWTVTFASENAARYFFNTASQIYVAGSRTGGTAGQLNTDLSTILTNMGTIKVGAQTTTITGSGGTAYAIGYYGLTGTYQTLYEILGSGLFYTNVSYTLRARVESVVGLNGGNGSVIRFQAEFATGAPSYDQADGTLTSSISQLLATGILSITAPTYATVTGL